MKITYHLTEREEALLKIFEKEKSLHLEGGCCTKAKEHSTYFKDYKQEVTAFTENGIIDISERWDGDASPPAKIFFLTEFGKYFLEKTNKKCSIICISSNERFLKTVPDFKDPW